MATIREPCRMLCCLVFAIIATCGYSHGHYLLPTIIGPMGPSSTPPPQDQPITGGDKPIVESFDVRSDIRFRFATTQLSSVMRNVASSAQEVAFEVTLPKEAFIMAFHMVIDGKRYDGQVKERAAAKREYQEAVDRGQSAGHVRQAPRHANIFQVSVNVAAGSAVNFTLTYQELLRRLKGLYEHEIYIALDYPVEDFLVEVNLQENRPLRFVRTPALRRDELLTNDASEPMNELAIIERASAETARVLYKPSVEEQGEKGITARFVLQYDVEHTGPGGDVLAVDGYFVHFLSPDYLDSTLPKDIVFVLDVSGSMSGTKISQLKVAMDTILSDLAPQDRFNILTFSSSVYRWQKSMVEADKQTIQQAKNHVRNMGANGGTNINAALLEGLKELRDRTAKESVAMIFFLTDGLPTVGVTDTASITKNIVTTNEGTVAIYSLAFGNGADYDALKQISAQNDGFARKIYEASDASLQVATLYNEISAVAIKDMHVTYQNNSEDEFSFTQTDFPIVFNGTEIVICGPFPSHEPQLRYKVTGRQMAGDIDISIEVDRDDMGLVLEDGDHRRDHDNILFTGPRDFSGLLERMWAYLTIKQLLQQQDKVADDSDKVSDIKAKVLELSLKYKLVTPLTSMVVTKPDHGEMGLKQTTLAQSEESGASAANYGARRNRRPSSSLRSKSYSQQSRKRYHSNPGSGSPTMRQHSRIPPRSRPIGGWSSSGMMFYRPRLHVHHDPARIHSGIIPRATSHVPTTTTKRTTTTPTTTTATTTMLAPITTTTTTKRTTTTPTTTTARTTTIVPITTTTTTKRTTSTALTTTTATTTTKAPTTTKPRRRNKKFPSGSPITLITFGAAEDSFSSSENSLCVVPKRWRFRNLLLLDGHNRTRVFLSRCAGRTCRGKPHVLKFVRDKQQAIVELGDSTTWSYSPTPTYQITQVSQSLLRVIGPGGLNASLKIDTSRPGRSASYKLGITVDAGEYNGGLLVDTLALPESRLRKLSRKKATKMCRHEQTRWSVILNKKMAANSNTQKHKGTFKKRSPKSNKGRGRH